MIDIDSHSNFTIQHSTSSRVDIESWIVRCQISVRPLSVSALAPGPSNLLGTFCSDKERLLPRLVWAVTEAAGRARGARSRLEAAPPGPEAAACSPAPAAPRPAAWRPWRGRGRGRGRAAPGGRGWRGWPGGRRSPGPGGWRRRAGPPAPRTRLQY